MEPAFRPGDRLWVDPTAYRERPPARGDVVIIADPADLEKRLLKRVVGVAGEYVRVTRDGIEIRASAGLDGAGEAGALEELQVPAEHVFVLSDRTSRTRDSRQFGPIPKETVLGRVWYRYYPPDRITQFAEGPQP